MRPRQSHNRAKADETRSPPARRARPRRYSDVHPARRGLVFAWWGFTATFAFLRLLTWAIHVHVAGLGNASADGVHLHHYLWGILLTIAVGVFGLSDRSDGHRAWMGLGLGIGLALIIDEIALLVELKDVYWSGGGAVSVGVGIILISAVGSALVFTRSPLKDA